MEKCEDCTSNTNYSTLCSSTLISEEETQTSYVKHRVFGPRTFSCNTHYGDITWPQYTDMRCYNDEHPINGPPIPVAVKYLKKKKKWIVDRVVCSPSCLFSELLKVQDSYNFSTLLEINMMMLRQCYGVTGNVWRAPDKACLDCYGGHMTIDEYRRSCMQATYTPVTPPFLSYSMVFEKVNHHTAGLVPPREATVMDVQQAEDFERAPEDSLVVTPGTNSEMNFKVRGLRIRSRKKASEKLTGETDTANSTATNFTQNVPLYLTFLDKRKDEQLDPAVKKKRVTRKRKTRPAEGGGMLSLLQQANDDNTPSG